MPKSGTVSGSSSRSYQSRSRPSRPISVASRSASALSLSNAPASHWQSGSGSRQKRVSIHSRQSSVRPSLLIRSSQPPQILPLRSARNDTASEHEDSSEDPDHVIMALDVKENSKIGCAYYVSKEERLLCMEDVLRGDSDTIERLKVDLQPTMVLISTRADALSNIAGDTAARRTSSLVDDDARNTPLPYDTELRPGPEFSFEGALNKLANVESALASSNVRFLVPGDNIIHEQNFQIDEIGLSDRQGRLLQISSWLDLDCKVSIGCAGAVVNYLQRRRASEFLQDDPDAQLAYRILHMEMFTFKNTMLVNADTLSALQIIQPESHPNAFNQGPGTTGSKESLSVFGLFHHHARTPQGKARLRSLFLRPSLAVEEIKSRLDFVTMFVRPDNQDVAQRLSKSLTRIKNMRNIMTLLHKGVDCGSGKYGSFKSGTWSSLLEFCYHTIDIVEAIKGILGGVQLPLCARALEALNRFDLQRIGRMIHEVVDLESSVEQQRTVVNRSINDHLDQFKDHYDGMDELLSATAVEIARTMPAEINCNLNVIFFPQLGFHITVPVDEARGEVVWSDPDWQTMFTTPNQVYFKDAQMRRMDQDLGDLWSNICDIEIEIAYELAQKVLQDEKMLVAASDLCGELDSLLALVHGALEHKLTRPRLVEENIIDIRGGRHLLQEMTVPSYVPNDVHLAGGDVADDEAAEQCPNMVMLTGPNYSGKSVYQKQVALIVYMAQIGSFVPADACTVGITDKILTRITTTETVSKAHSAFMIDLQQIAMALNSCTNRSLVVIDEFGKGTDTCDGAGLAAGVFYHLLNLGTNTPKVLAATHFHEIFELGLFDESERLKHAHMEVRVDRRDRQHGKDNSSATSTEVTYLYNLRAGKSSLSYGAQCAAINGIPEPIVNRAIELANLMVQGEDLVTVCSAMKEEDADELAEAEAAARAFLQQGFEVEGDEDNVSAVLSSILHAGSTSKDLTDSRSQEEIETGSVMAS